MAAARSDTPSWLAFTPLKRQRRLPPATNQAMERSTMGRHRLYSSAKSPVSPGSAGLDQLGIIRVQAQHPARGRFGAALP